MAKKAKPKPGPDDLVRASAGAYRSGDGRFEVQKADQGWFLVDTEQANEFGQQLIHGPFTTLGDVTAAIPGSRDIKPLLRSSGRRAAGRARKQAAPKKPKPPTSWIDRLDARDAADVRRLISALEGEGISGAEALVRRDRESLAAAPAAAALIEGRLRMLIADAPEAQRDALRRILKKAVAILTEEGGAAARPLPRWQLVETPRDPGQPARRIRPQV